MGKSKKRREHIFERLAKENNTTVDEVRQEIQIAINVGMASTDEKVRAEWAKVPRKGSIPTPEEALAYCIKRLRRGKTAPLLRKYNIY